MRNAHGWYVTCDTSGNAASSATLGDYETFAMSEVGNQPPPEITLLSCASHQRPDF